MTGELQPQVYIAISLPYAISYIFQVWVEIVVTWSLLADNIPLLFILLLNSLHKFIESTVYCSFSVEFLHMYNVKNV